MNSSVAVRISLWACISLFGVGCATTVAQPKQRAAVRALTLLGDGQVETEDVVALIDTVTTGNWRDQPDVNMEMLMEQSDLSTHPNTMSTGDPGRPTTRHANAPSGSFGVSSLSQTTQRELRHDVVTLVPLPSFRVEFVNRSKKVVILDPAQWQISDGHGATGRPMSAEQFRRTVEDTIYQRHKNLYDAGEVDLLSGLRQALRELPIFGRDKPVAIVPGGRYQAFVSFDFYTEFPIAHLDVTFAGTRVGVALDAPLTFSFLPEKPKRRKCPNADEQPNAVGVCPSDLEAYDPAPTGPCIQETRTFGNGFRKQIWVAGAPVADSDLYRTLKLQPVSAPITSRGLRSRNLGWALVGLGVATTVAIIAGFSTHDSLSRYSEVSLSGLAISGVGAGFVYHGQKLIEEGMRKYNFDSEVSGVCAPAW